MKVLELIKSVKTKVLDNFLNLQNDNPPQSFLAQLYLQTDTSDYRVVKPLLDSS